MIKSTSKNQQQSLVVPGVSLCSVGVSLRRASGGLGFRRGTLSRNGEKRWGLILLGLRAVRQSGEPIGSTELVTFSE